MFLEIDHHSGIPIYRQVIGQVEQQIMTGRLEEGEQLEAVRDLAARLKVNPMTISKAYSFLEAEGLLERRRGIGLFVAKIRKDRKDRLKHQLLNNIMNKAAAIAIQLRVPEDEAIEFFRKHYRAHSPVKVGGG